MGTAFSHAHVPRSESAKHSTDSFSHARAQRGNKKSKMARRTTNRKQQANVLKQAWEWANNTEPENVDQENVESAYRITATGCDQGNCRYPLVNNNYNVDRMFRSFNLESIRGS